MNKLREKLSNVMLGNGTAVDQLEQITDDFSISFGVWLAVNCVPMNTKDGRYNFGGKLKTTTELQQYFKNEIYDK